MDLSTAVVSALTFAPAAVLVITELLKFVPVEFTTKYPAWVNGILSVIAAVVVVKPALNFHDITALLATALFIAVVAAVSYNQFVSRLKTPTV